MLLLINKTSENNYLYAQKHCMNRRQKEADYRHKSSLPTPPSQCRGRGLKATVPSPRHLLLEESSGMEAVEESPGRVTGVTAVHPLSRGAKRDNLRSHVVTTPRYSIVDSQTGEGG